MQSERCGEKVLLHFQCTFGIFWGMVLFNSVCSPQSRLQA